MTENAVKSAVGNVCDALQAMGIRRLFPRGAKLFEQGQSVKGVYLIQTGNVRLWLQCSSGVERLATTAGPGSLLALSEAISGEAHNLSAQAVRDTEVFMVRRDSLLRLTREDLHFSMQIVDLLSEDVHALNDKFRDLAQALTRPRRRPNRGTR